LPSVGRTKNKDDSMPEKNVVPIVVEATNSPVAVTPDSYANEPIRFAPLQVVDLASEAAAVSVPCRNQVISTTLSG
jgi:hypothetical protein